MTGAAKTHHPQDEASFVSKVLFWWLFPLLWKGTHSPLTQEDFYRIREVEKSDRRTHLLEEKWREEMLLAQKRRRQPKLWRAMFRYFTLKEYWDFVPCGIVYLLGDNVVWFSTINLLRQLTSFYGNEAREEYFVYVYGIAFGSLMKLIGQNYLHFHGANLGVRARAAVLGMLYRKVLRLSKVSLDSGHVMELVCNDSQRLFTSAEWFIPYMIRNVLYSACVIAWLLYFIGWQIIPGSVFLLALGLVRFLLNNFDYKLRKSASQLSDKRLGVIRETLTIIRSVKLNCWETIYKEKIQKTRWQEIKLKARRWIIMLTCYSFISCGQHLATFITVLVFIFTQRANIPGLNSFALIALFRELSKVLCLWLSTSIRCFTDICTALQRVENFLTRDECLSLRHVTNNPNRVSLKSYPETITAMKERERLRDSTTSSSKHEPTHISLHDVTCKLPSYSTSQSPISNSTDLAILKNVTLKVATPRLVLVCGPVGSGKSSLLATLLGGELLVTNGFVKCSGSVAYVSDMPWVFPGTIRENILFGSPYEEKLYLDTVTACQLENDFKMFPQQDLSRIGEHGATLSGGQRTRVALARAVYAQADIYLLDDPLSSLDANVANHIFWECIRGSLRDRLVLMTTHASKYYREADHIVHLNGGIITRQGDFQELKAELSLAESDWDQKRALRDGKNAEEVWHDSCKPRGVETLEEQEEERKVGRVSFSVYKEYFSYGASAFALCIIALVFFSGQGLIVLVDVKASHLPALAAEDEASFKRAFMTYAICLAVGVVLLILGTLCIFLVLMNAAYKIHNKMITCLMSASLSFHAVNPVGRILNRFSQDMNNLDELLPFYFFVFCHYASPAVATVLLAVITTPLLLIPLLIALPAFYFISRVYFTSGTDIKRLMSIAGGPLYSHFSNTMEGLRSIRVYGRQNEFTDRAFRHIDEHHKAVLCSYRSVRWYANAFSIVCVALTTTVTVIVVFFIKDSSSAGLAAVTILYAVSTTQMIDYLVRVSGDVNSQMTSAERALAYTRIEPERGQDVSKPPPKIWPHAGEIEFRDVSLSHYTGGPNVLKNISFKINSSEKIGIAGRTGAGKSSLVAALMSLAETGGEILIDGENIKDYNLFCTRNAISVISQSPVLINGTIREHLDPSKAQTDDTLWRALERSKMTSIVKDLPGKLDAELSNSNFSVGEKQLLNVARVLLQDNKIVVFDEATGKLDANTETEIQAIVDEVFKDCTVITIAHRLSAILHCDRVMVLHQGEIKEFDSPDVLLNDEDGLFRQLQDMA